MSYHAEVQHRVAEMGLAIDPIEPHLERIAADWSDGVDHGATWPAKILSAKYHAVESSWRVVDLAMGARRRLWNLPQKRDGTDLPRRAPGARSSGRTPCSPTSWSQRRCSESARTKRRAGVSQANIAGLISIEISEMRSAGKPARRACSRMASGSGASYSQ